jgi:hypothetical protein
MVSVDPAHNPERNRPVNILNMTLRSADKSLVGSVSVRRVRREVVLSIADSGPYSATITLTLAKAHRIAEAILDAAEGTPVNVGTRIDGDTSARVRGMGDAAHRVALEVSNGIWGATGIDLSALRACRVARSIHRAIAG